MANLKVDTISGIGTEGTVFDGGLHFRSKNYLTLPKGNTTQRISTSSGISTETGSIRYNTDSNKMECYIGDKWMQVAVSSPTLNGGARGLNIAGQSPGNNVSNSIEFITIATSGSAADFGDTTIAAHSGAACADSTRGVHFHSHTPSATNVIDFVTFASTGNAQDFGDRVFTGSYFGAFGNSTRGIRAGAFTPGNRDVMEFVTIQSTGNSVDFGDLTKNNQCDSCTASPTRGLIFFGIGHPNTYHSSIDFVTIATTGNAQDFGDSSLGSAVYGNAGGGNATRGITYGGSPTAPIEYVTIASKGNTTRFGDLIVTGNSTQTRYASVNSSPTRMVICGGYTPAAVEEYYYINIATEGDFVEFGDVHVTQRKFAGGCSNGHGGL